MPGNDISSGGAQPPRPGGLLSLARDIYGRHTFLLRLAGVTAILLLGFWAGMGPRLDHEYPLHVDEWIGISHTQSMLEQGSLEYSDPYYRGDEVGYHEEMGFFLLLGSLKSTLGLSWMGLYRFGPGVLVALLAFFVYVLGRRDGWGWAAALFVVLIPTSLRTLGPAFLVPVSVAMLFIPVTLLVLHRVEARGMGQSLWLLLILIGGTIFVHPPTEVVVTAVAALYLATFVIEALAARRYLAAGSLSLAIGIRMLIPVIVLGVWLPALSRTVLEYSVAGNNPGLSQYLGFNTDFFQAFGVIAVALFISGVFIFTLSRWYGLRTYILPLMVIFLLVFLNFVFPRYQLGPAILYERAWSYLGFFMAVMAGFGVAYYFRSIPALAKRAGVLLSPRLSGWVQVILVVAGIGIVTAALTTGLANKERQYYASYYQMVGDQIYADFVWLGQHTTSGGKVVMMEPSLAHAYPPIAGPGNMVADKLAAPYRSTWANQVYDVFATGNVDTEWLREQDVSVMYTRWPGSQRLHELNNGDLPEIRPGVYLVPTP